MIFVDVSFLTIRQRMGGRVFCRDTCDELCTSKVHTKQSLSTIYGPLPYGLKLLDTRPFAGSPMTTYVNSGPGGKIALHGRLRALRNVHASCLCFTIKA
ncbi:hypothetical protein M422DRAFT_36058 [Sphaerobolus stellatus SS14]|uniref:Uncharacterized protein n=1 Tax=Sphaerobolus stellatus (strain SS14) TaxID=990650 RepID=A0A0C9V3C7_SPHS4|nr:hypothetical protein M422DRAFT_36058 [Sphaerobolus stellatus SS14]